MHDSVAVARAFEENEASFRLEGLDPSTDPLYQEVKSLRIAGKISADDAHYRILDHFRQHRAKNAVSATKATGFRMTPADPIGLPTTPEGHRLFEASVNTTIQASKQRLVDIGYTDAQGNVIRPEMGQLPTEEVNAPNGRPAN